VEEFRAAAVDRTVFGLLNLGASVELETDGLSTETRQELARKVVHRLQAETRYHGESLPLEEVMGHQARLLVQHIEGKACYETFVLPW
jgi:CRISPR/Cas system-associated endonuclease Cas1